MEMNSFKEYYLLEKTFNINQDVDYIYNKCFKQIIKDLNSGKCRYTYIVHEMMITSAELPSTLSQKAHKLNPIYINTGSFSDGSYYMPLRSKMQISLNSSAIHHLKTWNGNVKQASEVLSDYYRPIFTEDVSGGTVQSSIYHELSHWLDDTLHNNFISKNMSELQKIKDPTAKQKFEKKIFKLKKNTANIASSKMEINAVIHGIKAAKKKYKNVWDSISLKQLLAYVPTVQASFTHITNVNERKKWLHELLRRMARENLLGKNMTSW